MKFCLLGGSVSGNAAGAVTEAQMPLARAHVFATVQTVAKKHDAAAAAAADDDDDEEELVLLVLLVILVMLVVLAPASFRRLCCRCCRRRLAGSSLHPWPQQALACRDNCDSSNLASNSVVLLTLTTPQLLACLALMTLGQWPLLGLQAVHLAQKLISSG